MINEVLLIVGSAIIIIWGIAHVIPVKSVVTGFGAISQDNKRIITMEWIAEGITLIFIGALVLFITLTGGSQNQVSMNVYRASALMLIVMAILTGLTGARTSIIPIRICPFVKALVAILFFLGTYL
jgi:hypothetical protein